MRLSTKFNKFNRENTVNVLYGRNRYIYIHISNFENDSFATRWLQSV